MVNNEGIVNNEVKKRIAKYILQFERFEKSNLITGIHKKLNTSILLNWIFIAMPVLFYSIIILFLINNDILWNDTIKMSFIRDFSNSLGLSVLYFISYFLSWYFPSMFNEWMNNCIKKDYYTDKDIENINKNRKKSSFLWITIIVLFIIACVGGISFYKVASNNGTGIWMDYLNKIEILYYCAFLVITWYRSLSLLGMALFGGFVIYWSVKDEAINYNPSDFNKNISIVKSVDILLCTFAYGLFYIVGSILFILNDNIAATKGIYNAFSNDTAAFILVLIVSLIVLVVYIPLQEILSFMRKQKKILLSDISSEIENTIIDNEKEKYISKRNEIMNQSLIVTSMSNKIIIISSVLIPLIGVIFQGIELMNR